MLIFDGDDILKRTMFFMAGLLKKIKEEHGIEKITLSGDFFKTVYGKNLKIESDDGLGNITMEYIDDSGHLNRMNIDLN